MNITRRAVAVAGNPQAAANLRRDREADVARAAAQAADARLIVRIEWDAPDQTGVVHHYVSPDMPKNKAAPRAARLTARGATNVAIIRKA
jgi:hypothetical protein